MDIRECLYIRIYICSIIPTCSYTFTCEHPHTQEPIRVRTRARAHRPCLRAQRPRRIDPRPSVSTAWRAAGPKAAHTWYNVVTDAVFHAPMFALKANAW